VTSYLVRPKPGVHETWLLRKLHAIYLPSPTRCAALARADDRRGCRADGARVLLFTRIGAEFVPQLDEATFCSKPAASGRGTDRVGARRPALAAALMQVLSPERCE